MPEINQTPVEQLMEQAQVFASAWSLIDGQFSSESSLDDANDAKAELEEMLEDLIGQHSEQVEGMAGAVQKLIDWHAHKVKQLETLKDAAKEGVTLKFDGGNIELTAEIALGMRIALAVALEFVGELPIKLSRTAEEA